MRMIFASNMGKELFGVTYMEEHVQGMPGCLDSCF